MCARVRVLDGSSAAVYYWPQLLMPSQSRDHPHGRLKSPSPFSLFPGFFLTHSPLDSSSQLQRNHRCRVLLSSQQWAPSIRLSLRRVLTWIHPNRSHPSRKLCHNRTPPCRPCSLNTHLNTRISTACRHRFILRPTRSRVTRWATRRNSPLRANGPL